MNFDRTDEFTKDIKKLSKKWRSLEGDIEYLEPRLEKLYLGDDPDTINNLREAFFNGKRATILHSLENGNEIVKMRLDVASLGSNDKVRIVFVAVRRANTITFIELYSKNEKDREDQSRIKRYL